MESHENTALLLDIAHREARTVAVVPEGAVNRRQETFGLQFADVPERVFQHLLLKGDLRRRIKVLHGAAAAAPRPDAEVGAFGHHAQRRFLMDFRHAADFEFGLVAEAFVGNVFAGQGAFHENHLAVVVSHAAAFVIQALNVNRINGVLFFFFTSHVFSLSEV